MIIYLGYITTIHYPMGHMIEQPNLNCKKNWASIHKLKRQITVEHTKRAYGVSIESGTWARFVSFFAVTHL